MKLRKVVVKRIITAGILVCSFAISPCALALESQSAEVMVESVFIPDESGIEVTIPQIKKVKTNLVKQQETEIKENETYKEVFDYVYTTNLSYVPQKLKKQKWYKEVDCSNYLAEIINTLNKMENVGELWNKKIEMDDGK